MPDALGAKHCPEKKWLVSGEIRLPAAQPLLRSVVMVVMVLMVSIHVYGASQ
jgi:hypothetical protein